MKTLLVIAVILSSFALSIVKCLPVDNTKSDQPYLFNSKEEYSTQHACSSFSEETISRQAHCVFPTARSNRNRHSCSVKQAIQSNECYFVLSDDAQQIYCNEDSGPDGIKVICRCFYPSDPYPTHHCNLTIHDSYATDTNSSIVILSSVL